ncbi:hypothetical protein L596_012582 [Steinernema carpocapsae]|uniref:Aldehyde dehydrogenase domain-containing protein n=1 Tax=Steinernema carpocapsae TaxID=34508 RepID=A0A4U5NYE0_STECR|nr:hypothetical protein L596_012582 [Steinernema carpocapsae]
MDFSQLVALQREYFNTGATKNLETRKHHLSTLRKCITENVDKLCDAVYKDHRRDQTVTKDLEIMTTLEELDYVLQNLDKWAAPQRVESTDMLTETDVPMIVKDPLGVVLLISPWNVPLIIFFQPLICALAAGNTVINKPSEISANVSAVVAKIIPKYFDEKVVAVVEGGVEETTALLRERFDHIMYTGAPQVGKIVMAAAAKHLTPVTLELGGKCPVVVAEDADIGLLAEILALKKWTNCGQACIAPDYVMVPSQLKNRLVDQLKTKIQERYTKDVKSSRLYSRVINQRHFDRLKSVLDKSKGQILIKAGECDRKDVFIPRP